MTDWQPIDTAPKDGTEILGVFCRDYGDGSIMVDGPWTVSFRGKEWTSSWDGFRVIESQSDWGTEYKDPDRQPTHWMPLPPPPPPPPKNES